MIKLIQLEWLKLIKQKKAVALLVTGWVAGIIISIANLYVNGQAGFAVIDPVHMPLTLLTVMGSFLLPLIVFVVSADFSSSDFRTGTLKYMRMMPYRTYEIYGAKLMALLMYNGLLLAGIGMIGTVIAAFFLRDQVLVSLVTYFASYILSLLPITLVSLWGMFLGAFFGTGLSIGLGLVGIAAANVGSLFLPFIGSLSPIGYMGLYSMILYGNASPGALVSKLLYLMAYYIILVAVTLRKVHTAEL